MCCQLYLYSNFHDYVENSAKITARWILVMELEIPLRYINLIILCLSSFSPY